MSATDKQYTGILDECPCRYCVPPKRSAGCHAVCPEYTKWNAARQQCLKKMHDVQKVERDCFPDYRLNRIAKMKRR